MRVLAIFCITFVSVSAYAQRMPYVDMYKTRLTDSSHNIIFELKPTSAIKAEPEKIYYWYSSNEIHSTQGGYSGKLLNGTYSEFYPNKNLKTSGDFNKGLKDHLWKKWNSDGLLEETVTWSDGAMDGPFILYDENGKMKEGGAYHNNQLHGKITFYANGSTKIVKYQKGLIVPERDSYIERKFKQAKGWVIRHHHKADSTAKQKLHQ